MPITVNSQRPNGYVVLNTNATTFLGRPGDGGATDNKVGTSGETVQSYTIVGAKWSVSGTNTWTIRRGAGSGANSTMAILAGSGSHDYQADQMKLENSTANITSNTVITLSGGSGTLLLKLHKVSGE